MTKKYINEVSKDYDKCILLDSILSKLFVVSVIISIILHFAKNDILCVGLIVIHIIYILIDLINDVIYKNYAEDERRKTLLSNAFSKDLSLKQTKGYYNNNEKNSIKKLGINAFESTLFSKNTSKKMLINEGIKFTIVFIIWIIFMINNEDINLMVLITQTIFSAEILVNLIKLCYFFFKSNDLYNQFYRMFIANEYNESQTALLLEYVFEYECMKNYCHILLSEKIFEIDNPTLKKEWAKISKKIK